MDIQYGLAVIVIILGLALIIEGGENEFYYGAGWGTLAMGCIWVFVRMYQVIQKTLIASLN